MDQATLIRKIQTFTPNTPFSKLLKEEFDIDVPANSPKYQQEYLYKYCLLMSGDGHTKEVLISKAAEKCIALFKEFPWITVKYSHIDETDDSGTIVKTQANKSTSVDASVPDGTLVYTPNTKYGWACYLNGKIVEPRKSREVLTAFMSRKFGVKEFFYNE